MRKLRIIALTVVGLLAVSAAAFAASTNVYTVSADTSPTKAGTTKKPVPVKLDFDYTVANADGKSRPALINKYAIFFGGIVVNTKAAKSCSADQINNGIAQGALPDKVCPKGSVVGGGNVENIAGPSSDPTTPALQASCHLDLTIYNAANNHAALYLHGAPNEADASKSCPLAVDSAIDAKYVKKSGGTSLEFSVCPPSNPNCQLLHPINGYDNSVVKVKSTINKVTAKVKGKKVAYYQSAGGCKKGKRAVKVTFTLVDGSSQNVSNTAKCTT